MQKKNFYVILALAITLPLLLCGCSSKPSFVPVEGTVTLGEEGVEGAIISLIPVSEDGKAAAASTGPRGIFQIQTGVDIGCLAGDYRVTVTKVKESSNPKGGNSLTAVNVAPPKNLLPKKYASPDTSGLTISVKKGMEPVTLKLEK